MRKILSVAIGMALLAAALGACSSSGKSLGSNGTTETTQGGGSGNDEFSQLVAEASKANIKITYKQDDGKTVSIAQDGKGKSAFISGDTSTYSDGDTTVACQGTGADAKCTEIPVVGGIGTSLASIFTRVYSGLSKLDSSAYGGHVTSDTIAGRDARCVTFKASDATALSALAGDVRDPNAEVTTCVDKDTGYLLKLESKSNDTTKELFIATDVGEPTRDDFKPPATPEKIPGLGG